MDSSILIMILIGVSVAAVVVMATWLRGRSDVLAVDSRLYDKADPPVLNTEMNPDNSLAEGILSIKTTYSSDEAAANAAVAMEAPAAQYDSSLEDNSSSLEQFADPGLNSIEETAAKASSNLGARPLPLYTEAEGGIDNEGWQEKITTQLLGDSDCELFAERDLFSLLVFSPEKDRHLSGTQINEILDFIRSRHVDHRLALGALDIHHLSQRRKDGNFNVISYSLRNAIEPWSLDNSNLSIEEFSTPGLVFFMSVSLSDQPVVDFELMWEDASEIAKNYGLVVADDELGNPISVQQINAVRQLIAEKDWQKRIEREDKKWQARRQQQRLAQDFDSGF